MFLRVVVGLFRLIIIIIVYVFAPSRRRRLGFVILRRLGDDYLFPFLRRLGDIFIFGVDFRRLGDQDALLLGLGVAAQEYLQFGALGFGLGLVDIFV